MRSQRGSSKYVFVSAVRVTWVNGLDAHQRGARDVADVTLRGLWEP